jgi:Mg chelatase-related protein
VIARVLGGSLHGVDAFTVELEVDFSRHGLPAFTMVGLAEGAVREARDRVFSALKSANFRLPPARITVNLAPADRKKGGSAFDLPLAIGLLQSAGVLPDDAANGYYFAGELSLSGELRPVPGILPIAILARNEGARGLLVAKDNAAEAAVVEGLAVYPVHTVGQAVAFLAGAAPLEQARALPFAAHELHLPFAGPDFSEVRGQEHAKRAVEIACAGGHNLLFLGPPGSGKSMLAQRLPTVLPPLSFEEALEVTKIYSVAGMLEPGQGLVQNRPFRAPHHTISEYGLIGGGAYPRPGEISLAHCGVLFLDELLEFKKQTLEVLRQPLETGSITIARAAQSIQFPASCMLIAAMNPCPCGFLTDAKKKCTCSPADIHRYRSRLSGPLLDRIDLHVEVPAVPYKDLKAGSSGRSSESIRAVVEKARAIQHARYAGTSYRMNAELSGRGLDQYCALNTEAQDFLGMAVERLHLSARAYTRILRIARTIADMEDAANITLPHLAEAVNCRTLDRGEG